MFSSAILDVAIGLSFVFLLVSLLVTATVELLSGALKWRSTQLWDGLERLLQSKEARDALYSHPLIKGLTRADAMNPVWQKGKNGPSYIPSRTFALAILDILRKPKEALDDLEEQMRRATTAVANDPAKAADAVKALLDRVGALPLPGSLKADFESLRTRLTPAGGESANDLAARATREIEGFLEDARARWVKEAQASFQGMTDSLRPLLREAAGNVDRFRENVEIWFNDGMDRVSGWYKRRVAFHQAWIALGLAIVMNIDALQITRTLWREPVLRQALVANAEAAVQRPLDEVDTTLRAEPEVVESVSKDAQGQNVRPPIRAQLSSVRLFPDSVATVTVHLPPAFVPGQATNDEEREKEKVALTAARKMSNVSLGADSTDEWKDTVTITPAVGQAVVDFLIKAGPVSTPSLETIPVYVTKAGSTATLNVEVVLLPPTRFARLQTQIGGLGLPIGWDCPTAKAAGGEQLNLNTNIGGGFWCALPPGDSGRRWGSMSWWTRNQGVILRNLAMMVFGWLLTAAAASLGAPFWFDSLKRVISIRSSGKAPEERPLGPKEVSQPREPGQRPREADLINALKR